MNKEYWDYYFSKKKKLTDRAFKLRIAMLMTSILACAGIMASSAFALFEHTINSETKLTAATFALATEQRAGNVSWNVIGDDDKYLTITGPKNVIGYCKIAITNPQEITTLYYTPAFSGSYTTTITVPAEWRVAVVDAIWGYPAVEPELIIGGSLTISEPEQQTEQSEEKLTLTSPAPPVSDNTSENSEETPITEDTTESTTVTEKETVTEEKTVETTEKAENSEPTVAPVTPSVSEEKASVEKSDSTVAEAPVTSTSPSGSNSDSGTSNSSGTNASASDNGNSSGTSSSGNGGNDGSAGASNSSDAGSSSNGSSGSSGGGSESSSGTVSSGASSSPASDGGGE